MIDFMGLLVVAELYTLKAWFETFDLDTLSAYGITALQNTAEGCGKCVACLADAAIFTLLHQETLRRIERGDMGAADVN